MSYHYTESGLDNVYLESGYELVDTKYGKGLRIFNADQLHRAIAITLIKKETPLIGAELRYLRKHLDLSQAEMAEKIGADEQRVSRWERAKSKSIPSTADKSVRLFAAFKMLKALLPKVIEMPIKELPPHKFTYRHQQNTKKWFDDMLEAA